MTVPVIKSHLIESLRHLHLPMFVTHYAEQAALATNDGWSYDRYLLNLCELELNQREKKRIEKLLLASKLPRDKTIATFERQRLRKNLERQLPAAAVENAQSQRILFVLPVEPQEESHFGDGLTEIIRQELHPKHNPIAVAPSFEYSPWYADHPTNLGRRQESYFTKAIVLLVDRLYQTKHQHRLLLGFSKSGWGALSLILSHPGLFEAACSWDAPLMKTKPDQWQMPDVFVTEENFRRYQVSNLLQTRASYFRQSTRLGILGYWYFREQTEQAHELMRSLGIKHDYANETKRNHAWDSGWVEEAVSSLVRMADALADGSLKTSHPLNFVVSRSNLSHTLNDGFISSSF